MSRSLIVFLLGIVVALALAPWINASIVNHGPLQVPPEFADDSVYYYAQIHDVALGYPFIGNPYFKEHRGEMASSFFGAEWIASVPLLLHIPIIPAIIIDLVLGFAAACALTLVLCAMLGIRRWGNVVCLAFVLSVSYWLIERPVSMQVIFPCFLFFLISYLAWLKHSDSRTAQVALILSSALAFYVYTYLWQIVVIVLGLSFIFFFRQQRRLISLLCVGAAAFVLALPVIWYTYLQIHQQWYWQMITRTGFVETHTFGSAAVEVLAISLLMCIAVWILCDERAAKRDELLFIGITGLAILIASFSNVITGKDMETAIHFIRFTYLWAAIAGSYALYAYFGARSFDRRRIISWQSVCVLGIVSFFLFFFVQTIQGLPDTWAPATLASQAYAAPLQWFNENAAPGSVIFADDSFSYYVPVMTHDYVLFQPDGGLYLMPDSEVQDRYLASRMFDALSLSDIEGDLRLYAGAGNADDGPETEDRSAKLCLLFVRSGCPPLQNAVSYMGLPYFNNMYQRYQIVLAHPEAALEQFGVSYIVKDTLLDPSMQPEKLRGATLVATIGRFQIYSFAATSTAEHS